MNIALLAPRSAIATATRDLLATRDARLACIGRNLDGVDGDAIAHKATCDLTDFDAVQGAVEEAAAALGGLDGIANFAGSILLKPAHLTSQSDFNDTIAANLTTAFATVRAAGRVMAKTGGSVVLISTAAASLGMGNHEAIAAAKGGVEGLVRAAAATYATKGLRFNAVAPGLVETPLSEDIVESEPARKISESLHPLRRIGAPDDVARAVVWLLEPENAWVTGQVLGVDGGLSRVQPRPTTRAGS